VIKQCLRECGVLFANATNATHAGIAHAMHAVRLSLVVADIVEIQVIEWLLLARNNAIPMTMALPSCMPCRLHDFQMRGMAASSPERRITSLQS
jgi:hypothetical protein